MKKIALLLVCLLMTLACIAIAEEEPTIYTSGDYKYILLDDGTAEIKRFTGESDDVEIPEKLNGYIVTSIGELAFSDCTKLKKVGIPDSVTSIVSNPFTNCGSLTEIRVSREHPVFATIDGVLFNKTLKRLICHPADLERLNDVYSIPQGIYSIGARAFDRCYLHEIIIPNSVTSIGDRAFNNSFLYKIEIPKSVVSVGVNPFSECLYLDQFRLPKDSERFSVDYMEHLWYNKNKTHLIGYCFRDARRLSGPNWIFIDFSDQNSVSSIGDYAFYGYGTIAKVELPDSVRYIGDYAFAGCHSLDKFIIPDKVTSIGEGAFIDCSFESINIPDGVTSIANDTFNGCWDLDSINIPDRVHTIGDRAFSDCDDLFSVTIPDSVTSIGDRAFSGCKRLTSVTIPSKVTSIGDEAFLNCESLILTVEQDSYAEQYAKERNIEYKYPDSLDWLYS